MGNFCKIYPLSIDLPNEKLYNKSMKAYEHIQEFLIKYCDVDFKDELKPSTILAYFEEVASFSAEELGFGYSFVKPNGYAFMVTNICCEFLRPVPISTTAIFKTWPLIPTHVTFGREYQILDKEGEVYVNASSRWCLIDMATGKLLPSKIIEGQDYSTYNTKRVIEDVKWKIPSFKKEEGELKFVLTIANSEYDHNMHVNNTRYADYCFNCFSIAELKDRKLKKLSLSYIKQCKEGDILYFYRKQQEDGSYLTQGFNGANEIVVQALITFDGEAKL